MRHRFIVLFALAGPLFTQDVVELEMKKVASIADENEARERLQNFFRGNVVIREMLTKLQADSQDPASIDAAAREVARVRAEQAGNTDARLRSGSARMFRETGSTNLNSGSTSAVAKTSATEFLSMALESGAVTGSTDKSTATFQLNALPGWQFLSQMGGPYGCGGIQTRIQSRGEGVCESGAGFWLRGLTGSVSLNVNSKETAVPVLANPTGGASAVVTGIHVLTNPSKLSALGLKYELFQRERNTTKQGEALDKMAKELNESLDQSGLALKLADAIDAIINKSFYNDWVAESVEGAMIFRNDEAKLIQHARHRMNVIVTLAMADVSLNRLKALQDVQNTYVTFVNKIAELEAQYLFKKSMAFDFVHSRPTDQPFLNTFRLDFNTPIGKKTPENKTGASASIDFNAGVTMYNEAQTLRGKSVRLRNASASMALNYRMPAWGELGSPVLTLAGYYQYMFNNGLIEFNSSAFTPGASNIALRAPALEVLNTSGSIGLGQLRLEIPIGKDSGLTFPVAFSYANRTELIKDPNRKFWQGHVGLSYDLSKLQEAFLKGKKQVPETP